MESAELFLGIKEDRVQDFTGKNEDVVLLAITAATSGSYAQEGQIVLYRDKTRIDRAAVYRKVELDWPMITEFNMNDIIAFTNGIKYTVDTAVLEQQIERVMKVPSKANDVRELLAKIRQDQAMIVRHQEGIYQNMGGYFDR